MSGGVTQAIAVGEENLPLTGANPSTTWFLTTHQTHTNFGTQAQEVQFQTATGFGKKMQAPIPRNGDGITGVTLVVNLPGIKVSQQYMDSVAGATPTHTPQHQGDGGVGSTSFDFVMNPFGHNFQSGLFGDATGTFRTDAEADTAAQTALAQQHYAVWTNAIGHAMIHEWQWSIGGTECDKKCGRFLEILDEFGSRPGSDIGEMIGRFPTVNNLISFWNCEKRTLYIPSKAWFSRNIGHMFPYLAMHYHDLRTSIQIESLDKLIITSDPSYNGIMYERVDGGGSLTNQDLEATLLVQYVYLDGLERKTFAHLKHNYLIQQCQDQNTDIRISARPGSTTRHKQTFGLQLAHPTVALFVQCQQVRAQELNYHFNYSGDRGEDPIHTMGLKINSQAYFHDQNGYFYRTHEPNRVHTNTPSSYTYLLSFALFPMRATQPSGSLNFSKLENVTLEILFQAGLGESVLHVFSLFWNIFRFEDGMAGPVYAV